MKNSPPPYRVFRDDVPRSLLLPPREVKPSWNFKTLPRWKIAIRRRHRIFSIRGWKTGTDMPPPPPPPPPRKSKQPLVSQSHWTMRAHVSILRVSILNARLWNASLTAASHGSGIGIKKPITTATTRCSSHLDIWSSGFCYGLWLLLCFFFFLPLSFFFFLFFWSVVRTFFFIIE